MEKNVDKGSTDGFPDADFVCAFGDRDEHDVHDTDTANDKRDAGDKGEDARNNREEGASRVGDFVTIEDREIGVARFGGNKSFSDEFYGIFDAIGVGGADVDLLDLEGIVDFVEDFYTFNR